MSAAPFREKLGFADRLAAAVQRKGNPCVVGLDPRPDLLPAELRPRGADPKESAEKILQFCCKLIDLATPQVGAVKVQIAFFERLGPRGLDAYERTVAYAHKKGLLVIGDVKRGDIGATAEAYAEAHLGAGEESPDAITVNPFFGTDGVEPFLRRADELGKGLFLLVRTSNPAAAEIQDLRTEEGETVSERIAALVARWGGDAVGACGYTSVGAVVGATQPEALKVLRRKLPRAWLLLPGYGTQGGRAQDLRPAFDAKGLGGLVSSSRAVLYAYREPRFQDRKTWEDSCSDALREMVQDFRGSR